MEPRLYILMRTDMESMNAGKGMAQAAHAANAFTATMDRLKRANCDGVTTEVSAYMEWKAQTHQGFGTTIVLDAGTGEDLVEAIENAKAFGFVADVLHDPTYPVRDGQVTHFIPVDTCGYVFAPEGEVHCLKGLDLHLDVKAEHAGRVLSFVPVLVNARPPQRRVPRFGNGR